MIFLLGFLLADLFVSLKVGMSIGYLWSIVWILASMLLGGLLLKFSPYALMSNLRGATFGDLDLRDAHNASLAYLLGALLLILPGVLSDALGVLFLLYTLYLRLFGRIGPAKPNFHSCEGEEHVIDVEIIDEHDRGGSDRPGR